jgi:CRP-like cAMP-binding protein
VDPAHLKSLPLFSSLSERELAQVASFADEVDVAAGRHLIDEGRFAYEFFVIETGEAEVTQGGERVNTLGPGDFFGEIALLATDRRTATVTASSDMRLVVIHHARFQQLERTSPAIASQLREAVATRLPG